MTASLRESLAAIVGEKYVSEQEYVRKSYTRGPSWGRGEAPAIVVKPCKTEEVSEIVKLANQHSVPIIPRGGGASTALGGFPKSERVSDSILVDLTRMNRFLYLDEENMVAAAEAGIVLSDLSTIIAERGYHMHTVDIPQYIDTLGGVLSGFNGGGEPSDLAVVGELGNFILGLEVVLPNGDIITTGAGPGTNQHTEHMVDRTPGSPNITGMFLGDAGVFGIKTRVYFRVFPKQGEFTYGAFQFESFEEMWAVFSKLMRVNPYLYTRMVGILPVWEKKWTIFYVIRGAKEEIAFRKAWLETLCREGGGEEISNTLARDIIMTFSGRQLGKYYASRGKFKYFEHILRKSDAPDFLRKQEGFIKEKMSAAGLDIYVTDSVKYIVPKERHSVVMGHLYFMDEGKMNEKEKEAFEQIGYEEVDHLLEYGGFVEGAQGNLTRKSASVWQPEYHRFVKAIKSALDPNNILNPGLWRL
ncbi:MAG: FAD-binding oxidoreductase [Deltaproteobacteria bacterium]|nr:FAD-binding oxidoreductase [Deltaproteobacteria bacterium]MBW2120219.1 FAD-binding oxidoreductase [Deltaproteobacteria bacterium]